MSVLVTNDNVPILTPPLSSSPLATLLYSHSLPITYVHTCAPVPYSWHLVHMLALLVLGQRLRTRPWKPTIHSHTPHLRRRRSHSHTQRVIVIRTRHPVIHPPQPEEWASCHVTGSAANNGDMRVVGA